MNYKKLLPKRQQNSHKGSFGKILNIAGSQNFQGAAFLSSISALKIGAGYVVLACPENIVNNIASLTPDLTFLPLNDSPLKNIRLIEKNLYKYSAISIGCGLGTDKRVLLFFDKFITLLKETKIPLIIDADGLNAISILGIKNLPENTVLTPHEAEMARLMSVTTKEISQNRIFFAKEASKKFDSIVVLKGHESIICDKKQNIIINKTGNNTLSKAGTGDILTGIITGLAAQGSSSWDAAVLGVHLHGICGELAGKEFSQYSVLASDLLTFIPKVVTNFIKNSNFPD